MKEFLKSQHRILYLVGMGVAIGLLLWWLVRPGDDDLMERAAAMASKTEFHQPPLFVGKKYPFPQDTSLMPFALHVHEGKFLVSYLSTDRVDEFTENFGYIRSFRLLGGKGASITGVTVVGDRLYATDFRSGELIVADYRTRSFLHNFGKFPDKQTRMRLIGALSHDGNVYVTDATTKQILVISTTTVPGVREEWELILNFPTPAHHDFQLGYPTWMMITPDGRLVVSDAGNKDIKAFTCSGRPAHLFEQSEEFPLEAPMGIAMDGLPSPELLAVQDTVFHPSGVYEQGRIHVVDAVRARVKVFSTLGKYVLTYGEELRQPNGIAIDTQRRLIVITDAVLRQVVVYKY